MPPESTVRGWYVDDFEGFSALFTRARAIDAERWFDKMQQIADDGTNDWMVRQRETKGVHYVENAEAINRSRLRVDTLKWKLAKVLPKKYGDKIDHNVSGGVSITVSKTDSEL